MSDQEPKPEETISKFGETFDQVFKEELCCVGQRWNTVYGEQRQEVRDFPTTDNNLVGLAFSGGGIRSATINMGIAQALHRRGIFDHVDYMSTVSGGGYLGSSISTAMRELGPDGKGEFPYEYQEPEAQANETVAGEPREVETKFLTWVRNNSNYMATGGFLDWPKIFGVLLRGILANFLVLVPILLVLAVGLVWYHGYDLAAWEAADVGVADASKAAAEAEEAAERAEKRAAGGGAAAGEAADKARQAAQDAADKVKALRAELPPPSSLFKVALWFVGGFVLLTLMFLVFIRVYKVYKYGALLESGEESDVAGRGQVEMAFGLVLVAIVVAAALELLPLLIRWFHQIETGGLRGLYAGAGSGGALVVFSAAGKFLSKLGGLKQKIALLLVGLLGLVIPLVVALYVADDLIYLHPKEGPEAVAQSRAFAAKQVPAYLERSHTTAPFYTEEHQPMQFRKPFVGGSVVRLLPGILLIIIGGGGGAALIGRLMKRSKIRTLLIPVGVAVGAVAGYAILIGGSQALALLSDAMGVGGGIRLDYLVLATAAMVLLYCWAAVDVNLTAVLGLYRDRLAAAYLIGMRNKKDQDGNETTEKEIFVEPDLNLEDLCGGAPPMAEADTGDDNSTCRASKAPYHIVNTALNLQGSSDPMLRDRGSDFFMFSKLYYGGHRTGYCQTWRLEKVFPQMDLPTAMAISAAAASPNSGRMTSKPLVALMTLLNVRLGYWVPHPGRLWDWLKEKKIAVPELSHRWTWRVPPWALLREMISGVNEEDKWVNLSDGGHIENLAVYELLRRRCRYIICGDGEADPTLTFGGLATLMRSARIDMGIEIEILLDDLRLGEDRASHQHAALGKIKYPPLKRGDEPEEGYLLYIKSSFTGNEDETMQEYRAKSPDFPHESTADQFFDEGQFEAYRALGFHMADGLFPPRKKNEKNITWQGLQAWFHKLQADLAPRLSARHTVLRDELRRISKMLRRKQFHGYFYELYPGLDERSEEEKTADRENRPGMPEIIHLVGLQLDLMENAFLSLNLDQPVNWNHPGNAGWRRLFLSWAREPNAKRGEKSTWFRDAYQFLGHRHSGRFQNFCEQTLGLPPLSDDLERLAG